MRSSKPRTKSFKDGITSSKPEELLQRTHSIPLQPISILFWIVATFSLMPLRLPDLLIALTISAFSHHASSTLRPLHHACDACTYRELLAISDARHKCSLTSVTHMHIERRTHGEDPAISGKKTVRQAGCIPFVGFDHRIHPLPLYTESSYWLMRNTTVHHGF